MPDEEDGVELLRSLYVDQGLSVRQLSEALGTGPDTIRRRLRQCGIELRGRGCPRGVRKALVPARAAWALYQEGLRAAAKRLQVPYLPLWYRAYRSLKLRYAAVQAEASGVTGHTEAVKEK